MKLKTFLATYLLFLVVLFACFTIVSAFMTNSLLNMQREQSAAEFQRIAFSLSRDIAVLHGTSFNFFDDLNTLLHSYMTHYEQGDVQIRLYLLTPEATQTAFEYGAAVSFTEHGGRDFIEVTGVLPQPFHFFRLDYWRDITDAVAQMERIHRILLFICVGFGVLTAVMLHFILYRVFRPLGFVSQVSRRLAMGNYGERISVRGKNELSAMAEDFNRMADEIQRQVQNLKEEAAAKQIFIDNIAHELRTPLTSIFGYAEYMQKIASKDEETIECMQYIMDEAAHMQNISASLLSLATLRGYKAETHEIPVKALFDDVLHSLKTYPHAKTVQFICMVETPIVHGQPDLLKSLLLNLCTNAVKACAEKQSAAITMSAKAENGGIVLAVADNGRGIEPEALPHVTEPFYRADKARNREAGGAGLGLTLCKRIAEAHDAVLTIDSIVDEGTTVSVKFTTSQ